MTRYGPYPIHGQELERTHEGRIACPGAVLRGRQIGDEDQGYGYDGVDKVASMDQIWSIAQAWPKVAECYGRRLQQLGWRPLEGDAYRQPSGWPWDLSSDLYVFVREHEEIVLARFSRPADLVIIQADPALRAHLDETWFNVVLKAWSPGHERYPGLAEQLDRERRHRPQ